MPVHIILSPLIVHHWDNINAPHERPNNSSHYTSVKAGPLKSIETWGSIKKKREKHRKIKKKPYNLNYI